MNSGCLYFALQLKNCRICFDCSDNVQTLWKVLETSRNPNSSHVKQTGMTTMSLSTLFFTLFSGGDVAQMVERSLSM